MQVIADLISDELHFFTPPAHFLHSKGDSNEG
jgi:hypothetical protein